VTEETGTLAELNVKPGDVVEWISNRRLHTIITSEKITEDKWRGEIRANLSDYGFGVFGAEMFRLISRASDTPKTWGEMTDEERDAVPQSVLDDPTNPLQIPWRDMTPDVKGALLLAHHEGKVIESKYYDGWAHIILVLWLDTEAYRVRPPEPKRETVAIEGYVTSNDDYVSSGTTGATHRITFDVIDGKPDCASIRMEEL